MSIKICVNKFFLRTVGRMLPLRRHPGGKIANRIRCSFAKGIVQSMGRDCIIEKGAIVQKGCVFGDKTSIGPNCGIEENVVFKGYNMMAPNVRIFTKSHYYDESKHCFDGLTKPRTVTIGEHVWIGYGVIILPGVSIGDHTIIGAGSVVTKDIPSGVIAAGNPCSVKKVLDKDFYLNTKFD